MDSDLTSFYVTLPSNVRSLSNNTVSKYTTYLPRNLQLKGDWTVALTEISYTKCWYNVTRGDNIIIWFSLYDSSQLNTKLKIEPGFYQSIDKLCEYINQKIESGPKNIAKSLPLLEVDQFSRTVSQRAGIMQDGTPFYAYYGPEIEAMLGFSNASGLEYTYETNSETEEIVLSALPSLSASDIVSNRRSASTSYDLKGGVHSMFIYSDIVEPSIVGDSFTQLLRTVAVPENSTFGDDVQVIFERPYYIDLAGNEISSVEIHIKDEIGEYIKFQFGRTIETLHFKKKWSSIT